MVNRNGKGMLAFRLVGIGLSAYVAWERTRRERLSRDREKLALEAFENRMAKLNIVLRDRTDDLANRLNALTIVVLAMPYVKPEPPEVVAEVHVDNAGDEEALADALEQLKHTPGGKL